MPAEERVFSCIGEDPAAYPEQTALQRALKRWRLADGSVGIGAGVYPAER